MTKLTKENFAATLDQATEIAGLVKQAGLDLEARGIAPGTIGISYVVTGLEFLRKALTTQEQVEFLRSLAVTELNRGKTQH